MILNNAMANGAEQRGARVMRKLVNRVLVGWMFFAGAGRLRSQVFSPKLLSPTQVDTTDLTAMAEGIYRNAHATTEREKAEAIWRFFLTDGRFVKPGMFYHIPGWAYEEPGGEVLDPIKLVNTYGFGLCYQDAPLLQAVWQAGGFQHARVWFLTGHTVAEVFYEGQYHYYDSDMMGYTTVGSGSYKTSRVASVSQLSKDRNILLSKLESPSKVLPGAVDSPWYNADVRASAIGDLADLFSSSDDNYAFAFNRYSHGHTMDFVLRPGESMVRFYRQPDAAVRYLPYRTDGKTWQEFTRDYNSSLLVKNGPKSEKDTRRWSTGVIEYRPMEVVAVQVSPGVLQAEYSMPSPYVILGAKFSMTLSLAGADQQIGVETSTDGGHTWAAASSKRGPFAGLWEVLPATILQTDHGTLNAVSGSYGYLVRITLRGGTGAFGQHVTGLALASTFQFNPRTLPAVVAGENVLNYSASKEVRREIPVQAANATMFATRASNASYVSQDGQGYLRNTDGQTAEMVFKLEPGGDGGLTGVDVGGRFLDLSQGLAPDKLTAEVRKVPPWPAKASEPQTASIDWSLNPGGPWTTVWSYDPAVQWADGQPVAHTLRWPEVDRSVRDLHSSGNVYVRYRFRNVAVDAIRLATLAQAPTTATQLTVTHRWTQNGQAMEHIEKMKGREATTYKFMVPSGGDVTDEALILSAQ